MSTVYEHTLIGWHAFPCHSLYIFHRDVQRCYVLKVQLTRPCWLKVQLYPAAHRQFCQTQVIAFGPGGCYDFSAIIKSEIGYQLLLAPSFAVDGCGMQTKDFVECVISGIET